MFVTPIPAVTRVMSMMCGPKRTRPVLFRFGGPSITFVYSTRFKTGLILYVPVYTWDTMKSSSLISTAAARVSTCGADIPVLRVSPNVHLPELADNVYPEGHDGVDVILKHDSPMRVYPPRHAFEVAFEHRLELALSV